MFLVRPCEHGYPSLLINKNVDATVAINLTHISSTNRLEIRIFCLGLVIRSDDPGGTRLVSFVKH